VRELSRIFPLAASNDTKIDIDRELHEWCYKTWAQGLPRHGRGRKLPLRPSAEERRQELVRISDARMKAGTHTAPASSHGAARLTRSAAGGVTTLVENGDMIELDVEKRRLVMWWRKRSYQEKGSSGS